MSSQRQTIHSIRNKKFWTEFFYLYESLPVLWDVKNPLYKNRQVKCDAYDIMVDKLREIDPNADREAVLRKINIFRTNFRRECLRINTSLREGRHYQSTLWYFDLLCFIQTADTRRDRKRKTNDDGEKIIIRKRCNTKSDCQFIISTKKDQLNEYQPHSMDEYNYDPEEEPDFDYVPDAFVNELAEGTVETRQNPLDINNYQDEQEDDGEEQSQENFNHQMEFQNYTLQRKIPVNKNIKLTSSSVSQLDGEVNTNESAIEASNVTEEPQVFHEYPTENETLQNGHCCIKANDSPNMSTLQNEKAGQLVDNLTSRNSLMFSSNTSTKLVRDVKTMTSNTCHGRCCSKLSESSEILAKSWAVQYDEIREDQRLLARKAINDILFQGCMGHLAIGPTGRVIVNDGDYKINRTTKYSSNEEVESGEIYQQFTTIAPSLSAGASMRHGQLINISANVSPTPKVHTTEEWLKL